MLSFALGMIVRFFVQLFYMDRETLGNPEAMVALNHLLKWVFSITTGIVGIGSIVFITLKREKLIHKDSLWSAPHFTGATIAQFLYVAAQAGIFSFFINYMVEEVPAIAESMKSSWFIGGGEGSILRNGAYFITEKGATSLMSYMAFPLFLIGRFTGSFILRVTKAHNMLGLYSFINVILMLVIVAKLGWISVAAVFLSFFFMSIMFPTIFSLGYLGIGRKIKAGLFVHSNGHYGWRCFAKGDGSNCWYRWHVGRICCSSCLLYGYSALWILLDQTQWLWRSKRHKDRIWSLIHGVLGLLSILWVIPLSLFRKATQHVIARHEAIPFYW